MVTKHHGRNLSAQELREATEIGKDGVNLLGIEQATEKVGFKTIGVKVSFEKLKEDSPLPCIVHWSNEFSSQADADKTIAQYCTTGTGTCS